MWSSILVTPRSALSTRKRVPGPRSVALTLGLAGVLLFELHSGPIQLEEVDRRPEVAAPYEWLARQPDAGPVMEFPVRETPRKTTLAMYWSTVYWKPLVQGQSGFVPRLHDSVFERFVGDLRRPDGTVVREVSYVHAGNVGILQDLGVRYLVFHREGYKRSD